MPIFTGQSRFVNPEALINQVNDAMPGGTQNSVAGIQIARDPGQLGTFYYLSALEAAQRYGNVLFSGLYQYVQVLSTATAAPAQGQAAFWDTLAHMQNYIVTSDASASDEAMFAGVFLNAVTKGNFGWIQVAGIASVLYKSAFTGAAAVGVVVGIDPTPSNLFDVPLQITTAPLVNQIKLFVGEAITLPVISTLGQVLLSKSNITY